MERQLDHISQVMQRMFRAISRMSRVGCDETELTPAQSFLLANLEALGPMGMAELRQMSGAAQSTMSEMIGRLARLGFVHKKPLPEDRRTVRVAISARGRAMLAQRQAEMRRRQHKVMNRLTADEQARYIAALETLAALLEQAAVNESEDTDR